MPVIINDALAGVPNNRLVSPFLRWLNLTGDGTHTGAAITGNFRQTSFTGGAQTLQISFDTYADLGGYIELDGDNSDQMIFRVNDNFTTLVNQKCVIRGIIR